MKPLLMFAQEQRFRGLNLDGSCAAAATLSA